MDATSDKTGKPKLEELPHAHWHFRLCAVLSPLVFYSKAIPLWLGKIVAISSIPMKLAATMPSREQFAGRGFVDWTQSPENPLSIDGPGSKIDSRNLLLALA